MAVGMCERLFRVLEIREEMSATVLAPCQNSTKESPATYYIPKNIFIRHNIPDPTMMGVVCKTLIRIKVFASA